LPEELAQFKVLLALALCSLTWIHRRAAYHFIKEDM
jgi:hypothetical protein